MECEVESSAIAGNLVISTPVFTDHRGGFEVAWETAVMNQEGVSFSPVSNCYSHNRTKHTIRALHFQKSPYAQAKLVTCVTGRVWDVAVDIDPLSPTYKKWSAVELSPESGRAHLVPRGCAHGFATLEDHSTVAYLIDGDYHAKASGVVRWDDPQLNISWPVVDPILSDKDASAPMLDK